MGAVKFGYFAVLMMLAITANDMADSYAACQEQITEQMRFDRLLRGGDIAVPGECGVMAAKAEAIQSVVKP